MRKRNLILLGVFIIIVGGLVHWGWDMQSQQVSSPVARPPSHAWQFAPGGQTPGAVDPECIRELVCQPGYAESVRHLSAKTKHIADAKAGPVINEMCKRRLCEYDHLIPLELCGSNSPDNVWRQTFPEFRYKDRLENQLHAEVCVGLLPLKDAQERIKRFWRN